MGHKLFDINDVVREMWQIIECPKHLSITMVDKFYKVLLQAINQGGDWALDISPIEKVDSTGLQLMLSFKVALNDQGNQMKITGHSKIFTTATELLGLTKQFSI